MFIRQGYIRRRRWHSLWRASTAGLSSIASFGIDSRIRRSFPWRASAAGSGSGRRRRRLELEPPEQPVLASCFLLLLSFLLSPRSVQSPLPFQDSRSLPPVEKRKRKYSSRFQFGDKKQEEGRRHIEEVTKLEGPTIGAFVGGVGEKARWPESGQFDLTFPECKTTPTRWAGFT